MKGENQLLVTYEQVDFENNQFKFKTSQKLHVILERSME